MDVEKDTCVGREDGNYTSSAGTPENDSAPQPEKLPVLDFPPLSIQVLSPRVPPDGRQ